MSTLQDMLARKATENAAAAKVAAGTPSNPVSPNPTTPAIDSTIVTGMASSATHSAGHQSTMPSAPIIVPGPVDTDKVAAGARAYKSTGLRRYVNQGGVMIEPIDGWFYADTEQAVEILDSYAARGKVELYQPEVKK